MTSEPYDGQLRSVAMTDEAHRAATDALIESLDHALAVTRDHLDEHGAGPNVALADARWWTREAGRIAGALDALDPPGWYKPERAEVK